MYHFQKKLTKPFSAAAIESDMKMKLFIAFQSILLFNAPNVLIKLHGPTFLY